MNQHQSRREQAGVPPYPELRRVTLDAMRQMTLPATNEAINQAVADRLNLTASQRAVLHLNSNQTELAYSVAWARTALNVAGAAENVGRALWTLTDEGRDIAIEVVNQRYDLHLAQRKAERDSVPKRQSPGDDSAASDNGESGDYLDSVPIDWREELLARLRGVSPSQFEHLAASLLGVAGFDDVEVTGRSGDGGIDGIGVYRPSGLISFHTAFQCKRYRGTVGAGAIRDFRGSFIGRADRGIMITTGYFSEDAKREASRAGANPVELIDGERLTELLKEHSLGVRTTPRVIEDVTIDESYFNQFEDGT